MASSRVGDSTRAPSCPLGWGLLSSCTGEKKGNRTEGKLSTEEVEATEAAEAVENWDVMGAYF